MKVEQINTILNNISKEVLGESAIVNEDLSKVVSVGQEIAKVMGNDNYVKALINHIGKVIFVNRRFTGMAPNVLMDGWEYGSILEKIDADMPEYKENKSWQLTDGTTYNQDVFNSPKGVRAKFFNDKTTFEVDISIVDLQVKESFSSMAQMGAFFSMIETKIQNALTVAYKNLVMRTINNFSFATLYKNLTYGESNKFSDYATQSSVAAINLLKEYKDLNSDYSKTAAEAIRDPDFIRYCAWKIAVTSDRMEDISTLFNIGRKQRFTPKDKQHLVLLSDFSKAADVYLQSSTFHNEFTKLPKAETVLYWQGTGTDYSFDNITQLHISTSNLIKPDGDAETTSKEFNDKGIIGVLFDHDALGINNVNNRVTTHYNASAEFTNFYYKSDARYFNDYDENFVVFYVA